MSKSHKSYLRRHPPKSLRKIAKRQIRAVEKSRLRRMEEYQPISNKLYSDFLWRWWW